MLRSGFHFPALELFLVAQTQNSDLFSSAGNIEVSKLVHPIPQDPLCMPSSIPLSLSETSHLPNHSCPRQWFSFPSLHLYPHTELLLEVFWLHIHKICVFYLHSDKIFIQIPAFCISVTATTDPLALPMPFYSDKNLYLILILSKQTPTQCLL